MDSANYLDQTHHATNATNATAWMINGPDQVARLQVRATTVGVVQILWDVTSG